MTGTRGQSGRDPGDHGIAQVTCPRQSRQSGLQSCSHRGSSTVQCVGGVRPLPARPLRRDRCPVSKGLFAERPPGLKGQQPEPQPASCHQGPCCFADNKPWDKLRLERETQSKPENLPGLTKLPEPQLQGSTGACWPPSGHAGGGRGTGMRADGGICPRSCSQLTSTK